jgi:hypothetical protein
MTRWGVGRSARTAVPASVSPPTGATELMPPRSQGAEQRTDRHAGRWALRALVVGGLAGAAWLLTGAAAQAADRVPTTEGQSLLGSVVDSDSSLPGLPVTGLLHAVTRPLEADAAGTAHRDVASTILAAPARVLARPAATLTSTLDGATREHSATDTDTATGGIVRVVKEITGPLRLSGGSDDSPLAPVSKPLTRTTRHFTGLLPQAAVPMKAVPTDIAPGPVAAPVAHRAVPVSSALTEIVSVVHAKDHVSSRHAVAEAAGSGTIREDQPGGNDDPAPMQGHYGAISGISTTGSGAPTEGGSAAFLPAAVAAGTMAFHRLPRATDVEVRRLLAEAPTVSPD